VAFVNNRRILIAPLDGSKAAAPAFAARGASESPAWSPDGQTLAFVLNRGDHRFIGLFMPGHRIRFVAPSTSRDSTPVWAPDGRKLAFVRQPGIGGVRLPLSDVDASWDILVADTAAAGHRADDDDLPAQVVWTSGKPVDRILQDPAGIGL